MENYFESSNKQNYFSYFLWDLYNSNSYEIKPPFVKMFRSTLVLMFESFIKPIMFYHSNVFEFLLSKVDLKFLKLENIKLIK